MSYDEFQAGKTWQTVRNAAAEVKGVDPETLTPETVLLDLGFQSLDFVSLVSRLERLNGVVLPREFAVPDRWTLADYYTALSASTYAAER